MWGDGFSLWTGEVSSACSSWGTFPFSLPGKLFQIFIYFSRHFQEHPDLLKAFSPYEPLSEVYISTSQCVSAKIVWIRSSLVCTQNHPKFYICKSGKWNMCSEAVRNVSSVQITFSWWISLSHLLILLVNWKWLLWTLSFYKSTYWVGTTACSLLKILYPGFKKFPVHKVRRDLLSLRSVVVLGTRVYEHRGGGNQGCTSGEKGVLFFCLFSLEPRGRRK